MSSENDLRCNNLKCRAQLGLEGKAVVTSCSHIFCVPCANTLFASSQNCPACDQVLSDPDDIVLSSLNPTNEYKASILSGLAPSVVLEVAVRAISFYQYQTTQETAFQKLITKSAQEKLAVVQRQLESSDGELQLAKSKIHALEQELTYVSQKKAALVEEARIKDKDMMKLRAICDRLKRKAVLGPSHVVNEAVEEQVQFAQHQHQQHQLQHQHQPGSAQRLSSKHTVATGYPVQLPHSTNYQAPQPFYEAKQQPQRSRQTNHKPNGMHTLSGEYARSNGSGNSPRLGQAVANNAHRSFYDAPLGGQRQFGM